MSVIAEDKEIMK